MRGFNFHVLLVCTVLAACSTKVNPDQYNRTCTENDECIPARTDACRCPDFAINESDKEQHEQDVAEAREWCAFWEPGVSKPCRKEEAGCTQHECRLGN